MMSLNSALNFEPQAKLCNIIEHATAIFLTYMQHMITCVGEIPFLLSALLNARCIFFPMEKVEVIFYTFVL